MLFYVLKSGACLGVLLLFYKLFLERESVHTFKRYYLLFALVIVFSIPLITFTNYIDVSQNTIPVTPETFPLGNNPIIAETKNYLPTLLWTVYAAGVLFFYIRFMLRTKGIVNRITQNPTQRYSIYTYVLLNDKLAPHTFLKYIFLNKDDYCNSNIPREVIIHEEAHARQNHTIDILFVEILQIVLWFNPLIYFAKQSIRLNHEFLADREVLNKGVHSSTYQKMLLAFSSNAQYSTLASAINYSSFKKRFTVMKKQTSTLTWLKSALLLPLLAVLVYSFSDRVIAQKESNIEIFTIAEDINIYVGDDENIELNKVPVSIETLSEELNKYNNKLSVEERKKLVVATVNIPVTIKMGIVTDIKSQLRSYGVNKLNLQERATIEMVKEYNKLAKKYKSANSGGVKIEKKEIARIHYIYGLMSKEQKAAAEPYPNFPPPPAPKQEYVKEEIIEVVEVPAHPTPPTSKEVEVIEVVETPVEKERVVQMIEVENMPTPPPPPDPVQHFKELEKQNAKFYYNGKPITAKRSIELVKSKKTINISVYKGNNGTPTVKLTDKPIKH